MHVFGGAQNTQRRGRTVPNRRLHRYGADRRHSQQRVLLKERYPAENLVRWKRRAPAGIGFGDSDYTPEFRQVSHRFHFARGMGMRGADLPAWHRQPSLLRAEKPALQHGAEGEETRGIREE